MMNVFYTFRTLLQLDIFFFFYESKNQFPYYFHDYSYLNEAEKDALALWDDYLIYAVLLEENTQIQKEIMARMKQ